MNVVDLAPIVKQVELRRTAAQAFDIFTRQISAWWPLATHTLAKDAKGERTVRVIVEPRVGGRIYEILNTGEERAWGEVTVFEPGRRFAFHFHMSLPRERSSHVDIRFEDQGAGQSRVTLTHDRWDRLGDDAAAFRGRFDGGWMTVFVDGFGRYEGP